MLIKTEHDNNENGKSFSCLNIWKIYLQVGFIGLFVAFTMWYTMNTGTRIAKQYPSLVDAAMEIKLEATLAHLWLEEIISGDRHVEISEVWSNLDQAPAEWYAQAMLYGGENEISVYIPLQDPELRNNISDLLKKISIFRSIAKKRLANLEESSVGSKIDQRFDKIFDNFLKQADVVETSLLKVIKKEI